MALGAALLGTGRAVADFGEQWSDAEQSNAAAAAKAAAAQQTASERAAALAERKRQNDLKRQQLNAKRPLGTPYAGPGGKMYQRYYDPVTRAVTASPVDGPAAETKPEEYKRSLLALGMTEEQATKAAETKFGPSEPKTSAAEAEYQMHVRLFGKAEADRMEEVKGGVRPRARLFGPGAGGGGSADVQDIGWWAEQVKTGKETMANVPAKIKLQVAHAMRMGDMNPGAKMTTAEQNAIDATKQLMPMVDDTLKMLAPHKEETGPWSAIKQHGALGAYKLGISPGKDEEQILQTVSFLQLLGVQPWTKTGRGKYIFEQIEPHLPKAGDSLGLIYQKLETLKSLLPSLLSTGGGDAGSDVDAQILKALGGGK